MHKKKGYSQRLIGKLFYNYQFSLNSNLEFNELFITDIDWFYTNMKNCTILL